MGLPEDIRHAKRIHTRKDAINFCRHRGGRYARINGRRHELIDRKCQTSLGLTPEERKELDELQKLVGKLVCMAYPFPKLTTKLREFLMKLKG